MLSAFETFSSVFFNARHRNGFTNAYAGTVLLLADNPLLIDAQIPLALLDTILH